MDTGFETTCFSPTTGRRCVQNTSQITIVVVGHFEALKLRDAVMCGVVYGYVWCTGMCGVRVRVVYGYVWCTCGVRVVYVPVLNTIRSLAAAVEYVPKNKSNVVQPLILDSRCALVGTPGTKKKRDPIAKHTQIQILARSYIEKMASDVMM